MLKLIVFIAFSSGLMYISRASLLAPRSHGFYRFLAWESILSLVFLNFEQWFRDPFSIRQLVSWFLLVASLVPLALGVHQLRILGRVDTQRRGDVPLIGTEKTTQLVTTGVFRYIRHPLYSSLFLLAWGLFFKNPSFAGGFLALGATAFLLAMVKVEEEENIRYFGPAYEAYIRQTRIFIPFFL